MSETPPEVNSDSWVDLSSQLSSPNRVTPLSFDHELLLSAQRESSSKASPISSALMSLSSTTRNSPMASPKSPPNSPNPNHEPTALDELGQVYINHVSAAGGPRLVTASDLLWEWTQSNKPASLKDVRTLRSRKSSSSSKLSGQSRQCQGFFDENDEDKCVPYDQKDLDKEEKGSGKSFIKILFASSKRTILALLVSNLISLFLGAGIGIWLMKRAKGGDELFPVPL